MVVRILTGSKGIYKPDHDIPELFGDGRFTVIRDVCGCLDYVDGQYESTAIIHYTMEKSKITWEHLVTEQSSQCQKDNAATQILTGSKGIYKTLDGSIDRNFKVTQDTCSSLDYVVGQFSEWNIDTKIQKSQITWTELKTCDF